MRRSYEAYGSPKWETQISHDHDHYPPLATNLYFPQSQPSYPSYDNYYYPNEPPKVVSYQEEFIIAQVPQFGPMNHHPKEPQFGHMNHHPKEPVKHVRFVEKEKVVEMGRDKTRKEVVVEESIDMEANNFIQQRHKNFAKWNTFNM